MLSVNESQRRTAREKGYCTFALMLDSRTRDAKKGWKYEIAGPLPPACYDEMHDLVRRWEKDGLI